MDDTKQEELEKTCKRICNVRARMVAIRMVLVLDTADTIAARRYIKGCKSPRVCCICVGILGSTYLKDLPVSFRRQPATGLEYLPDDKPDGFVAWCSWYDYDKIHRMA